MSSASIPPRKKKTKVRTRYMIPMRLWSVVLIQSTHCLLSRGFVTSWTITWGTGRSAVSEVDIRVPLRGGRCGELAELHQPLVELEHLLVAGGDVVGLLLDPLLVGGRSEHADERGHSRVEASAQLRALTVIEGSHLV